MNKKEWKRRMAYEALILLGLLALLLFITRLWPILLLVILGIFVAYWQTTRTPDGSGRSRTPVV